MITYRKVPVRQGFTLIELLVVIGMIGVLAATVLVAVNPLRQFAQARNAQRISNVNAILNAVGNRIADNQGIYSNGSCGPDINSDPQVMKNDNTGIDVRGCLVPNYIAELPFDPSIGTNSCDQGDCQAGDYDTGYTIQLSMGNRIKVCAPESVTDGMAAPYCLTR